MPTSKTVEGPTPNGGVRSIAYFKDKNGNPVDQEKAVAMEIIEIDKEGKEIFRTYMEKGQG